MQDFEKTIAILVGVSSYNQESQFPPLPAAVKNIDRMTNLLYSHFGMQPAKQIIKIDDPRNYQEFEREIEEKMANRFIPDRIIFYFAGHGTVDRYHEDTFYLAFKDTHVTANPDFNPDVTLANSGILPNDIMAILRRHSRNLVLLVDSCYSAAMLGHLNLAGINVFLQCAATEDMGAAYPQFQTYSVFTDLFCQIIEKGLNLHELVGANNQRKAKISFRDVANGMAVANPELPFCKDLSDFGGKNWIVNNYPDEFVNAYADGLKDINNEMHRLGILNVPFKPTVNKRSADQIKDNTVLPLYPIVLAKALKELLTDKFDKEDNVARVDQCIEYFETALKYFIYITVSEKIKRSSEKPATKENVDGAGIAYNSVINMDGIESCCDLALSILREGEFSFFRELRDTKKCTDLINAIELVSGFSQATIMVQQWNTLIEFTKSMAFLCNYNLAAIQWIGVEWKYYQPVKYIHEVKSLMGYNVKKTANTEYWKDFMRNPVIVVYRPEGETAQSNEQSGGLITLWPFLVDAQKYYISSNKAEPMIYFLQTAIAGRHDYAYKLVDNVKDTHPYLFSELFAEEMNDYAESLHLFFKHLHGLDNPIETNIPAHG